MKPSTFKYLLLFIVGALTYGCSFNNTAHNHLVLQEPQRILVLNSYSQGLKWTDDIVRAIDDTFKDAPNIIIHNEYMNTKVISSAEHFEKLRQRYKNKYANYPIDVIISSDDNALQFLREHRQELFPGVPIVFCGVNNFTERKVRGFDNYTGVNEKTDNKSNFELILKLHPDIKTLYVVNGSLTTARSLKTEFIESLKEYEDKFDFEILSDFSLPNLVNKVASLEKGSVLYYLTFYRDNTGRSFTPDEVVPYLSNSSPAPIYSATDDILGHGIVGGMLRSSYFQGEAAAKAAQKILQGVSAREIPVVMNNPSTYMFDYYQLQRFSINLSDLPEGSIIIDRPES